MVERNVMVVTRELDHAMKDNVHQYAVITIRIVTGWLAEGSVQNHLLVEGG